MRGIHAIGLAVASLITASITGAAEQPKSIDDVATHKQTHVIKIVDGEETKKINAFCLNEAGEFVVACGEGPGEICIADETGKVLRGWSIDVKPEAIHVTSLGSVLAGGQGKLFRYSAEGELIASAEAPNVEAMRKNKAKLRLEAVQRLSRNRSSRSSIASRLAMYERMIKVLEDKAEKGNLTEQEEMMAKSLPTIVERFKDMAAQTSDDDEGGKKPSKEAIDAQVENLMKSRMRVSSISSGGAYIFAATRASAGYGYDVWRMDPMFNEPTVVVKELRGCCGQMDVQCCKKGMFVAENSRHRVVRYDGEGKVMNQWGKRDRSGKAGFTSCCNPMNVCFSPSGDVYTAEASTGRITRFDAEGNLLSYIGDVDLVPGCKNVSIAASADNDKVFMLDLTRSHIVVMQSKESMEGDSLGSEPEVALLER